MAHRKLNLDMTETLSLIWSMTPEQLDQFIDEAAAAVWAACVRCNDGLYRPIIDPGSRLLTILAPMFLGAPAKSRREVVASVRGAILNLAGKDKERPGRYPKP